MFGSCSSTSEFKTDTQLSHHEVQYVKSLHKKTKTQFEYD